MNKYFEICIFPNMFMGWSFFFKNKESPYFLSFKGIVIAYGVPLLAFQYNLE